MDCSGLSYPLQAFFGHLLKQRKISQPEFEFLTNELAQRWRGESELPTRNPGCTVKLIPIRHEPDPGAETHPVGAAVKECTTVESSDFASDLSFIKLRADELTSIDSSDDERASIADESLASSISIVVSSRPEQQSEVSDVMTSHSFHG